MDFNERATNAQKLMRKQVALVRALTIVGVEGMEDGTFTISRTPYNPQKKLTGLALRLLAASNALIGERP